MNIHDEYEKIAAIIGSGESETVASVEKFESYPNGKTTASSTTYSSARKQARDIVNVGHRYVGVVDDQCTESWRKLQFRHPNEGRYTQNNSNGYRTQLRQQSGSYNLDLWEKLQQMHNNTRQVFTDGACDEWEARKTICNYCANRAWEGEGGMWGSW